ncbi:MAG: hypothetical protein JST31_07220 [Actinobacteria bacterium]|nr:hypothetical protein [Actinomycetota bacterium]
MRGSRTVAAVACLLAGALGLSACGGGGESGGGTRPAPPVHSTPAPAASSFPTAKGKTLREIINEADGPSKLKLEPQAMVFYPGPNRYPFLAYEKNSGGVEGKEVDDAEVAIYYARVPSAQNKSSKAGVKGPAATATRKALDEPAFGPFPAKIETLATQPQFESKTTKDDPTAARVVYSAQVPLPKKGQWRLEALIKEGNEVGAASLPTAAAGEFNAVPAVGTVPPRIHTPTAQDVGGDLSKITTRIPPDTQNEVDFADALGKEPILLLFASPKFCQSRVCSPVVDVAEQAKAKFGNEAKFIHMEIYNDKNPSNVIPLQQVRAFHLPSEPWLFAMDREGVVKAAIEGGFGSELMDEAVEKAVGK